MLNNILYILKEGKNKLLYKINNETITYQEAYNKVLELSSNLKKQGNSCIIVYGHKSINQFISILSCVVAKRCYIPIDLCTPQSRIEEIIKKTNTTLVIKNEELQIKDVECLSPEEINNNYKNKNTIFTPNNNTA